MDQYINLLVTLYYDNRLLDCAIKVDRDDCSDLLISYPMEPESREELRKLMPEHISDLGPIVAVREIFEISKGIQR